MKTLLKEYSMFPVIPDKVFFKAEIFTTVRKMDSFVMVQKINFPEIYTIISLYATNNINSKDIM